MARHIISVCIFCFICASHSPCASHAVIGGQDIQPPTEFYDSNPQFLQKSRKKLKESTFLVDNTDGSSSKNSDDNSVNSEVTNEYLRKIFLLYGNGEAMTIKAFEKLIAHLELYQILSENSDTIEAAPILGLKLHNNTRNYSTTCFNQEDITTLKDQITTPLINYKTLHKVCPFLLYSIIANKCPEGTETFHVNSIVPTTKNGLVWLYSILAVVLISACGVLALAIIPVMQKRFYKPLIQFLVALAVGTLAGDALLHLLPHAMTSSHSHPTDYHFQNDHYHQDHHRHDENTWKGFVAMLGLTFFFIMERLISLVGKWRKCKQKHPHSHITVLNERRGSMNQTNDTQCMDKYNSFPYCYKDIMNNPNKTLCESDKTAATVLELGSNSDMQSCKKSRSPTVEKLETNQNMTECSSDFNIIACTEVNKMLPSDEKHDHEDYTVILREHKNEHHGHSHKHGHVHAAPQNFSSVAWMVIMGDGLHNFTDGMAIGAAFSEGIAGGFSTTLAVFCHELPHELGDFAMLLKAGMSIKQALFYNILSSILCILGNVFGLWLGNTDYASSWVFAVAAGMFIYIALVDMIPELSSAHEDEGNLMQCILHLGGLLLGFGIMTVIALYEHDLKNLFNDPE